MRRSVMFAVAAAVLLAPATATAQCGERATAGAQGNPLRRGLILGDSTMVYAAPILGRLGISADARTCRQYAEGLSIVRSRRPVPHLVVLALGANGPVSTAQLQAALNAAGRNHIVGFVTPKNSAGTAARMRAFARAHPARVMVIDWAAYSAGRPLFSGDGLHPTPAGARVFAQFVMRRIRGVILAAPKSRRVPVTAAKRCGVVRRHGRNLRAMVLTGAAKITCRSAQRLVSRAPLAGIPGWSWYDWTGTPAGPWIDVYLRDKPGVIVASQNPRRRP